MGWDDVEDVEYGQESVAASAVPITPSGPTQRMPASPMTPATAEKSERGARSRSRSGTQTQRALRTGWLRDFRDQSILASLSHEISRPEFPLGTETWAPLIYDAIQLVCKAHDLKHQPRQILCESSASGGLGEIAGWGALGIDVHYLHACDISSDAYAFANANFCEQYGCFFDDARSQLEGEGKWLKHQKICSIPDAERIDLRTAG